MAASSVLSGTSGNKRDKGLNVTWKLQDKILVLGLYMDYIHTQYTFTPDTHPISQTIHFRRWSEICLSQCKHVHLSTTLSTVRTPPSTTETPLITSTQWAN